MRRFLVWVGSAGLAVGLLAGPAAASTTTTTAKPAKTSTASTTKAHHRYDVIVGTFRSQSLAQKRVSDLTAKGATGFTVKTLAHKKSQRPSYRVQQVFSTHKAAMAEARTVRKDGFHARVVTI